MAQISAELRAQLGPLAPLVGVWEGDKGIDVAPSDGDRHAQARTGYRERVVFEQVGPVQNHEQNLHVLRYSTRAFPIGPDGKANESAFHEEVGYWSWEPATREALRCFLIPRGISVIAGGQADAYAQEVLLKATAGSCTYGVCVNPFLEREFKIESYECELTIDPSGESWSYDQVTWIRIPGREALFEHRDRNTLRRART